jgi:shikimate dehydrogenase
MTSRSVPALAGVIGWPIAHSKSPRIHRFWLEQAGIDGDYVRLPVAPEGLGAALSGLAPLGFRGVNVTIPHKQAVIAACDDLTPLAKAVGAVNTIVVRADGGLLGHNTDVGGFALSLPPLAGPRACVLGAGGAARAIVTGLSQLGISDIRVVARDPAKADDLPAPLTAYAWDDAAHALDGAQLLVNCTSLGMTGQPPLDLDLASLARDAVVNDIVYAPLETPLLAAAKARGLRTVDGLAMLIGQAAEAFGLFFGDPPNRAQDAALRARLLA